MRGETRKLRAAAAFVFLAAAGVHFASGQTDGARSASPAKPAAAKAPTAAEIKEIARLKTFLDKNGGYKDSFGGYYNPTAGTYTDEKGGVLDSWEGYTYKDGSYKSKFGDYYDSRTNSVKFASGEQSKVPSGSTAADVIAVMRQSVEENGGYDKAFIQKAMLGQIQKDHPLTSDRVTKPEPAAVSGDEARLMKFVDRNGGYLDSVGGYYDPKAGTYTDKEGGVVDNWKGYTYTDGSYKSGLGDYWDGPTKTFKLADGRVAARPGLSNAEAIRFLRQNVEQNGGYDKDLVRRSMMESIRNEHPVR